MASKKKAARRGGRTRKSGAGPSKSEFIRQHPETPAADIVAKAKAQGMTFSPAFVYAIRSKTRKSAAKAGGAPASAAKKTLTASDFVRSMPSASAKDVVTAAAKRGLKVSANLVYMVRSTDRKKGGGPAASKAARGTWGSMGGGSVAEFKKLALSLGLENARSALAELERGLAQLLGG